MAKKATKKNKTGKVDGRSKAARAAKAGTGNGGNGRDLHLTDNGGNEEAIRASFLQHRNREISAKAARDIAEKKLREIYADAKSEGFTKKQFIIAAMLTTGGAKKEAKVIGEVKDRLQVARWVGHAMGKRVDLNQLDMDFDAPAGDPVESAYAAGEQAGLAGETANVPGHYSASDLSQAWMSGHHKGQATVQKGIKPLEEKADNVVGPAAGWGTSKAVPT